MRRILLFALLGILGCCAVGFAVVAPFYTAYRGAVTGQGTLVPVSTHDMAQHLAVMKQFDVVLRSGTLYPRWLPDINRGYGAPWTNFYPVGFYYLTSLVNVVTGNWMTTLFVLSGLGLAASAIAFYLASRGLYGRWPSALAALLYMVLPYHLVDLYWRGAMPEFMVFVLIPPIFYFASKLSSKARPLHLAAFALSYGALIFIHVPTSFLMAYALAFYALIRALQYRDPRVIFRLASGMVISYALGAIYLVPALLESKFVYQPWTAVFPYSISYLKIFSAGDTFGDVLNLSAIGCSLILLVSLATIIALPDRATTQNRPGETPARQTTMFLVMGIATVFMSTSPSKYISRLMPEMDVASFAWRWLAIASFFVCLALAAGFDRLMPALKSKQVLGWCLSAALVAAVGANLWFAWRPVAGHALSNPPLNPPANFIDNGFTPKDSARPGALPAQAPEAELSPNNGFLSVDEWSPTMRKFTAAASVNCELRIRSYNFPGWAAQVDGKPAEIVSDKLGTQTVPLLSGNHKIQVAFENTAPRSLGAAVSGVAFLLILLLFGLDIMHVVHKNPPEPTGPETTPGA
jgi:hypothetical protein